MTLGQALRRLREPLKSRCSKLESRPRFRPQLEGLETRLMPVVGRALQFVPLQTVYDGVVKMNMTHFDGTSSLCTGSLLGDGQHILTAAHCLTDGFGIGNVGEVKITFEASHDAAGLWPDNIVYDLSYLGTGLNHLDYSILPKWDGNAADGNDMAIIDLPSLAPSGPLGATRYNIYRASDEVTQRFTVVGYGNFSSDPNFGEWANTAGLAKTSARNTYEATSGVLGADVNILGFKFHIGLNNNTQLVSAFKNGVKNAGIKFKDWLGYLPGTANVDALSDEGMGAHGDSGGPQFVQGLIAGVTSNVISAGFQPLDSNPGTNSSYGDLGLAERVSIHQDFIDSVVFSNHNLVLDMTKQIPGNDGKPDTIEVRRINNSLLGPQVQLLVNGEVYDTRSLGDVQSVTIVGSNDNDTFIVDRNLGSLPVSVDGGLGTNTLVLPNSAAAEVVTLFPGFANTTVGGSFTLILSYKNISGITVNADSHDVVRDLGSDAKTPITINDPGKVMVGTGFTNAVLGDVTINKPVGTFFLVVDDSMENGGHTVQVNQFALAGMTGGGVIHYDSNHLSSITLNGDAGDDAFIINADGSAALDALANVINVNGGGGQDNLIIHGEASGASAYSITDQAVNRFEPVVIKGITQLLLVNTFRYSGMTRVFVDGSAASANSFDVHNTPPTTRFLLYGGAADDTFTIGDSRNTLGADQGSVLVDGGQGNNTLLLDDRLTPAIQPVREAMNYVVTDNMVNRIYSSGKPPFASTSTTEIDYFNMASVQLLGFGRPATYSVLATAFGTPVDIQAGAGDDIFQLGDATHSLDLLQSAVTLDGQGGTNLLTFDDSATKSFEKYTLTSNSYVRENNQHATLFVTFAHVNGITANAGSGGSTFELQGVAASAPVTLNGGAGGQDTFQVDRSFNNILGPVTIHGQLADNDVAAYYDFFNPSPTTYTMTANSVSAVGQAPLYFDGLGEIVLYAGSGGGNVVNVQGVALGTLANILDGNGDTINLGNNHSLQDFQGSFQASSYTLNDQVNMVVDDSGSIDPTARQVSFSKDISNYIHMVGFGPGDIAWFFGTSSQVTVIGSNADTSYAMQPFLSDTPLFLQGGTGVDTLDYSAYTTDVYVNFLTGIATDLAGFSGFENAIGGSGNNTIIH